VRTSAFHASAIGIQIPLNGHGRAVLVDKDVIRSDTLVHRTLSP
jgi:hypothetical protein